MRTSLNLSARVIKIPFIFSSTIVTKFGPVTKFGVVAKYSVVTKCCIVYGCRKKIGKTRPTQ